MKNIDKKSEQQQKEKKHIVSFSGGKDSTAMLLRMIEEGWKIDEVINCDTSVEFPEMYRHIEKLTKSLGIKITTLHAEHDFEFYLLHAKRTRGKNMNREGFSFPDFRVRWCTDIFKVRLIKEYLKKYKNYEIIEYHGIAYDEQKRLLKKNGNKTVRYPLNEWKMTEADCLQYCYDRGYTWEGLYDKFARLSCWCCPLSRIGELRILWKEYPELWAKLESWQDQTYRKFRSDYSVHELTAKFEKEEEKKLLTKTK